ncbi:hypothetical protein KA977_12855 [Candidatus Dependentiae bacterium]|nr:hypothetical protein [Candidatus Dependentiae bacterium]
MNKSLHFHGPYSWRHNGDCVFDSPHIKSSGIYLHTFPYTNGFIVYYVGETGDSFQARLTTHAKGYISGEYRLLDYDALCKGEKKYIWQGLWKTDRVHLFSEFYDKYDEYVVSIKKIMDNMNLFIAPLEADQRMRRRIEGAIGRHFLTNPGFIGQLPDTDNKLWYRKNEETPLKFRITAASKIFELPDEIQV